MTTQKEMSHINTMFRIISDEGCINKFDLMTKAKIGISWYEKLKPYLEHLHGDKVRYNTKGKLWEAIPDD